MFTQCQNVCLSLNVIKKKIVFVNYACLAIKQLFYIISKRPIAKDSGTLANWECETGDINYLGRPMGLVKNL